MPTVPPAQGAISSATIQQAPSLAYKTPTPTPIYPVAGLGPAPVDPNALTAPEQAATDVSTRLQELNNSLVGESSYRADQEKAQGIQALTQTQNDLTSRLTALKNEALAIPLQLQQDATGRGVTAGGLQPHQTAALRNNAIQALSVNSLLEASRGNLTTALDMVDRAVAQKYDPIKEEISAKTANLDLILKSPEYSLAEKRRAQAQLDIQNKKATELAQQKELFSSTQKIAVDAAAAGADPVTLDKIAKAASPVEAMLIAAQAGFANPAGLPASAQEYLFAKRNGYTGDFTAYQNEDANRKRSIAAAGVANASGLNTKQVTVFNSLVDKYNKSPLVAANDRAVILRDITSAVAADPSNASLQVSFIYSLIQALDTYQSAVREGEIGLIAGTQGLGEKLTNLPSQIQNGNPLNPSKIQQYVATSKLLTDSIGSAAARTTNKFSKQAEVAGIGGAFNEFTSAINGAPAQTNNDPLNIGTSESNPLGI